MEVIENQYFLAPFSQNLISKPFISRTEQISPPLPTLPPKKEKKNPLSLSGQFLNIPSSPTLEHICTKNHTFSTLHASGQREYKQSGRKDKRKGRIKGGKGRDGEKESKARTNTRVETAAQDSPEGATEMGWKTNQGHRGDFAAALLLSLPYLVLPSLL